MLQVDWFEFIIKFIHLQSNNYCFLIEACKYHQDESGTKFSVAWCWEKSIYFCKRAKIQMLSSWCYIHILFSSFRQIHRRILNLIQNVRNMKKKLLRFKQFIYYIGLTIHQTFSSTDSASKMTCARQVNLKQLNI